MIFHKQSIFQTLLLFASFSACEGYPTFQDQIPNGAHVPHPCQPNKLWKGVGHQNRNGGGVRNPFGKDFEANGMVWTHALCMKDSDGDGKTNGEELGDPNCVWAPEQEAEFIFGLSHPGICEPVGSALCGDQPAYVSCEKEEFVCDAVNEVDTLNFTARMALYPVPEQETSYMCMLLELPQDGDYHMVGAEPLIDNVNVVHHIFIYGCSGEISSQLNQVYKCSDMDDNCFDIITGWTVGMVGQCAHPHTGFRIGSQGYRVARIELHWNNPLFTAGYTDSSGMTLYLSPQVRMYDAGIFTIGQSSLIIPPGQSRYEEIGTCPAGCTKSLVKERIYVTSVINHMHYLGIQQVTELFRDGKKIRDLANDEVFSFDSPVDYIYAEPIELLPGDEIRTKCVYKSTSRDRITYYGEDTSAEMCFSFLTYYPKENLESPFCVAYKNISTCDWYSGKVQGCEYLKYMNTSHPDTMRINKMVTDACSPHTKCLVSCKPVVKEVKEHPCFQGYMDLWLRQVTQGGENTDEMKVKALKFYAALDSCDYELGLESAKTYISAASDLFPTALILVASAVAHFM